MSPLFNGADRLPQFSFTSESHSISADIIVYVRPSRAPRRRPSRPGSALRTLLAALALALPGALLLSACGEKKEPTGSQVALYPVSVRDGELNRVTLDEAPASIGIAGQAPARLAAALGIPVTRLDDGSGNLDLGTIRRLEPDLLLSGSEINQVALTRARGLGIAVYITPDRTLDGIEQALTDIGLLANEPVRGRVARKRVARAREQVKAALAGATPVRIFFNVGRFATVSSGSFIGSVIAEAGGVSVAGADPNEGPFPLERLARLRPQVLVLASNLELTLTDLRRKPFARGLPAVRSGRIVRVDMQQLEPGPDAVIALRRLARAFHPDAFR